MESFASAKNYLWFLDTQMAGGKEHTMAFLTSVEEEDFDGMRAWRLTSPEGPTALVAERGATLLSWRPREDIEVIDGYESAKELCEHTSGRSLVMVPWCGRIAQGSFSFAGKKVEVSQPELAGVGALLADVDFTRVPVGDALKLVASLEASEKYPWDLSVSVLFSLEAGIDGFEHLSISIEVLNTGEENAPVTLGWRPFIKVPLMESISNASLSVPARAKVLTDSDLIPLMGDAAFAGIASPMRIDYLGSTPLDQSYTQLVPNEDGVVVTSVTNPARGAQVLLTQEPSEAPVVHVYTGDHLERASRQAIALSPCSALQDAFNRADAASRVPLESGQSRALTATLSYRHA